MVWVWSGLDLRIRQPTGFFLPGSLFGWGLFEWVRYIWCYSISFKVEVNYILISMISVSYHWPGRPGYTQARVRPGA
jgi:hypothetical protein